MPAATSPCPIDHHAPIRTWFRVGGGADRLARPADPAQLAALLQEDPDLRILGSGANLLIADSGVRELVVRLDADHWKHADINPADATVTARAGTDLARLILDTARAGLAGLEGLGGVPASLGGAIRMNAGGRFGEISQHLTRVRILTRDGTIEDRKPADCRFAYRHTALQHAIILEADFQLTPDDPAAIRARLKDVMAAKKHSQPMGESSAGCCFKNPRLSSDLEDIAPAGTRVSAGLLIDRAGCKGLSVGGATVSTLHANFLTTSRNASAADLLALMRLVQSRVHDAFGITLEREVVVWGEPPEPTP
ncbi:MAG: UDP-N-acetylmuramate dehydrogenase [Phycisphaerales bacterium JB037]